MPRRPVTILAFALAVWSSGCDPRGDELTIVVIPKGLTHEHWQSVHRGALRAADDLRREQGLSVRIIWDGPLRERDALAQIRIVDRRVAMGVDGIVLAPQHSQTMGGPVARAVARGIPVVVIDSGLDRKNLYAKYVATDNRRGGYLAADHLLKVLSAEGKSTRNIVMMRYQVGSESTEERETGFLQRIDEEVESPARGHPPIRWLSRGEKYSGATRAGARNEAGPLINRFVGADGVCEIDGFFAPNESSASGVLDVLKSLKLNKKVRLVGFDSSQPLLKAIEEGDVDASILQDPYRMGYMGVWAVVHARRGYDVQSADHLSTGETVVTRENLNAATTIGLFSAEAQARRSSEELRRSPVTGDEIRWAKKP